MDVNMPDDDEPVNEASPESEKPTKALVKQDKAFSVATRTQKRAVAIRQAGIAAQTFMNDVIKAWSKYTDVTGAKPSGTMGTYCPMFNAKIRKALRLPGTKELDLDNMLPVDQLRVANAEVTLGRLLMSGMDTGETRNVIKAQYKKLFIDLARVGTEE